MLLQGEYDYNEILYHNTIPSKYKNFYINYYLFKDKRIKFELIRKPNINKSGYPICILDLKLNGGFDKNAVIKQIKSQDSIFSSKYKSIIYDFTNKMYKLYKRYTLAI